MGLVFQAEVHKSEAPSCKPEARSPKTVSELFSFALHSGTKGSATGKRSACLPNVRVSGLEDLSPAPRLRLDLHGAEFKVACLCACEGGELRLLLRG